MELTISQENDLIYIYERYLRTHSLPKYNPKGIPISLKTGKYLFQKGLVEQSNECFTNRHIHWFITAQGIKIAKELKYKISEAI